MIDIRVTIPCAPVAWQRTGGSGRRRFKPKKTRTYEELVGMAARAAMRAPCPGVIDEPVFVDVIAVFARPKRSSAHYDKQVTGYQWRPCVPDGDNLRKAVLDGLRPIWTDDALVVGGQALKVYAELGGSPRVDVHIYSAPPCAWTMREVG